jgi:hypothetical protein
VIGRGRNRPVYSIQLVKLRRPTVQAFSTPNSESCDATTKKCTVRDLALYIWHEGCATSSNIASHKSLAWYSLGHNMAMERDKQKDTDWNGEISQHSSDTNLFSLVLVLCEN